MKYLVGVLVVFVIILTGTVSYLAGRQNITLAPSPLPTSTAIALATAVPTSSPTTQMVQGGGVLSFPRYELTLPANWTIKREVPGPDSEKIVLDGGTLGLTILQGGFGGSVCLFPGNPDSEGPSARYIAYVEITNRSGDKFRRVTPENGKGFGLCQLSQYNWNTPTFYGAISLKTPTSPTTEELNTIDNILASLTKL
ncbi:MAG: hypothetical protein UX21_C0005G0008 [Microgenomates group bacterium GW2011_GWC2_45_8]|nr:MAG: hypothetical protein UX21_C0005G0008 [Microgenomates group bacterium GW2011_GWC2_45_8]